MSANKPVFTSDTEDLIFKTARRQVLATVLRRSGGEGPDFNRELKEYADTPVLGTFVSFKKRGQLRSCMGWMNDGVRLAEALRASSISAAREDPRFPPLSVSELDALSMEVWVLWGMEEVAETGEARLGTFQIGRHGLQIHSGGQRGLLLPGVAVEFKMSPLQFLEAVCQKAGLAKDAWKSPTTVLYRFEGLAIDRPFYDETVASEVTEWKKTHSESDRFDSRSFGWNLGTLFAPVSRSSNPPTDESEKTRPAAVAGMFYPGSSEEQTKMLDRFLAEIRVPEEKIQARAVMVPHAGWVYSGRLALATLASVKIPETVLIIAPKHRGEGTARAINPTGFWDFGGGRLANDLPLSNQILEAVPEFRADSAAHRREHAIEVLLPMIAKLAPQTKVVGAVLGYGDESVLTSMAEKFAALYRTLKNPPLLIISSDMNHYESQARTIQLDQLALDALETLHPKALLQTVSQYNISMCGVQPAYFVLETLRLCGYLSSFHKIGHTTSAEASGDTRQVVGYAGYAFQ